MGRLDGQVAWVTGAASGIGKAIAATFAAEGAEVAALDIDDELGERVVKEINDNGGKAIFIKCDVAREAEVQDALERTAATFDGLDILANNAGIVQVGPLDECTEEAWDQLMGVNVKSTSGPVIDRPADLAGLLTKLGNRDVFFIDEVHRINRVVEEYLYSAMEDFTLDIMIDTGPSARSVKLNLEPFTLIGATTRAGLISAPLRARFGLLEGIPEMRQQFGEDRHCA